MLDAAENAAVVLALVTMTVKVPSLSVRLMQNIPKPRPPRLLRCSACPRRKEDPPRALTGRLRGGVHKQQGAASEGSRGGQSLGLAPQEESLPSQTLSAAHHFAHPPAARVPVSRTSLFLEALPLSSRLRVSRNCNHNSYFHNESGPSVVQVLGCWVLGFLFFFLLILSSSQNSPLRFDWLCHRRHCHCHCHCSTATTVTSVIIIEREERAPK